MQGSYRGEERNTVREQWRTMMIPGFIRDEISPWLGLMKTREDVVALDIGANKGWWSKALIESVNVRHSYMIDASPENHHELANRGDPLVFTEQDFPKISAHHYAMGDRRGFVDLFTNDDGSPLGSLYAHKLASGVDVFGGLDRTVRVPMTTIDHFMAAHPEIYRVNALKIDAEGSEFRILQGAHGALAQKRIDLIFYEFGMHHVESRVFFRDFYELLADAGFKQFRITHGAHELEPIEAYSYRYEDLTTCHNFVAVLA